MAEETTEAVMATEAADESALVENDAVEEAEETNEASQEDNAERADDQGEATEEEADDNTPAAGSTSTPADPGAIELPTDLNEDAPPGHEAYNYVTYTKGQERAIMQACSPVVRKCGHFQVTLRTAGGCVQTALRVVRLCYVLLEKGIPKEKVLAYKTALLTGINASKGLTTPVRRPHGYKKQAALNLRRGRGLGRSAGRRGRGARKAAAALQDVASAASGGQDVAIEATYTEAKGSSGHQRTRRAGNQQVPAANKRRKTDSDNDRVWEDVEPNHVSRKLNLTGKKNCPYVCFRYISPEGPIQFQATAKRAGSVEHCLRIARLCYKKFEEGYGKDEVIVYREGLYSQLDEAGLVGGKVRLKVAPSNLSRPATAQTDLVRNLLEGYHEEDDDLDDVEVDSSHCGRRELPKDSPIRPSRRKSFVFVVQSRTAYTRAFSRSVSLVNWQYEVKCDLCNGDCRRELYMMRAYQRDQPLPRKFHHALLYAGTECCKILLRERQLPPGRAIQREVSKLMAEETWEEDIDEIVRNCESKVQADCLLRTFQRLLAGESAKNIRTKYSSRLSLPAPNVESLKDSTRAARPLGAQALSERLRPLGLKVRASSSVWTAVARALGHQHLACFAKRAREAVWKDQGAAADGTEGAESALQAADSESEETSLRQLLGLLRCDALVYDAAITEEAEGGGANTPGQDGSAAAAAATASRSEGMVVTSLPDCRPHPRRLLPTGGDDEAAPLATLTLCCIYGRFAAAGVKICKADRDALARHAPALFAPLEENEAVQKPSDHAASSVAVADGEESQQAAPVKQPGDIPETPWEELPPDEGVTDNEEFAIVPAPQDRENADAGAPVVSEPSSSSSSITTFQLQQRAEIAMRRLSSVEVTDGSPRLALGDGTTAYDDQSSVPQDQVAIASEPSSRTRNLFLALQRIAGQTAQVPAAVSDEPHRSVGGRGSRFAGRGGRCRRPVAVTPALPEFGSSIAAASFGNSSAGEATDEPIIGISSGTSSDASSMTSSSDGEGPSGEDDELAVDSPAIQLRELTEDCARWLDSGTGRQKAVQCLETMRQMHVTTHVLTQSGAVTRLTSLASRHPSLRQTIEKVIDVWKLQSLDKMGRPLYVVCRGCSQVMPRAKIPLHLPTCPGVLICAGCRKPVVGTELEQHEAVCKEGASCPGCSKSFDCVLDLRKHAEECTKVDICPACTRVIVAQADVLKEHMTYCASVTYNRCCNRLGMRSDQQAHIQSCPRATKCLGCDRYLAKVQALQHYELCFGMSKCVCGTWVHIGGKEEHAKVCKPVQDVANAECGGCHGKFRKDQLLAHFSQCDKMEKCSSCQTFVPKVSKKEHEVTCSRTHIPCRGCGKMFSRADVKNHELWCSELIACVGCQKRFLKTVVRSHMDRCEKVVECQYCGKQHGTQRTALHLRGCEEFQLAQKRQREAEALGGTLEAGPRVPPVTRGVAPSSVEISGASTDSTSKGIRGSFVRTARSLMKKRPAADAGLSEGGRAVGVQTVSIPHEARRGLIGLNGATVRDLQSRFKVHINIPRAEDKPEAPLGEPLDVTVEREDESADLLGAVREIQRLAFQQVIEVPQYSVGAIIGQHGGAKRNLEQKHEVRICFLDKPGEASGSTKVRVVGAQQNVQEAVAAIVDASQAADEVREVVIPDALKDVVVGRSQCNVRRIEDDHGVKVIANRDGPTWRIKGPSPAIDSAEDTILNLMSYCQTVQIPVKAIGRLIGAHGATVVSLETSRQVRVWVDRNTGDVEIQGRKADVENTLTEVRAISREDEEGVIGAPRSKILAVPQRGRHPASTAPVQPSVQRPRFSHTPWRSQSSSIGSISALSRSGHGGRAGGGGQAQAHGGAGFGLSARGSSRGPSKPIN
eukprot:TRINITY_DN22764_c0_g1_i1.p1 TRINITY_DN22764_c0_g1~~TRINITY_DN22764_c0_g1_i1.p1  ORF type:complete len:1935 (-),score=327.38 TRINITY_DN22764_c0_g1_i1:248-5857(-)